MSGKTAAGAAAKVTSFRNNPYWSEQRAEVKRARINARNLAMAGGAIDYRGRPVRVQQRFPIVKGDIVQVTTTSKKRDYRDGGRPIRNSDGSFVEQDYFGQQGVVLRVKQSTGQIVVQGVNLRQRVAQVNAGNTHHAAQRMGECAPTVCTVLWRHWEHWSVGRAWPLSVLTLVLHFFHFLACRMIL